jgi:hypothetical protein
MHKTHTVSLASLIALSVLVASQPANAAQPRDAVAQNCDDLNYTIKREGSPYHYSNPNEGCGISLQLDGLPTKSGDGYSNSGNDACRTIRNTTTDLQGKLNERLQGALAEIGDVVGADDLDAIAASAGVDASGFTDVMRDGVDFNRTFSGEQTETLGALSTRQGRQNLGEEFLDGARNAVRESGNETVRSVQQGTGSGATPGINSQGESSGQNDWSIFD